MSEVMEIASYELSVSRQDLANILENMPESPDPVYFELLSDTCAVYAEQNGLSPDDMQEVLNDIERRILSA